MDIDAFEKKIARFITAIGNLDELAEQVTALRDHDPVGLVDRIARIEERVEAFSDMQRVITDLRADFSAVLPKVHLLIEKIEATSFDDAAPAATSTPEPSWAASVDPVTSDAPAAPPAVTAPPVDPAPEVIPLPEPITTATPDPSLASYPVPSGNV